MPKLIIDDREIEVAPGTKVIEAAARLGIVIPRFCYHPALGSVGACRVCAVKFLQGPFKGVQMSCMIDATNDMVVQTKTPQLQEFRRGVLELMLSEHPHPCLTCWRRERCGPFDICLRNVDVTQRCITCPRNESCEPSTAKACFIRLSLLLYSVRRRNASSRVGTFECIELPPVSLL